MTRDPVRRLGPPRGCQIFISYRRKDAQWQAGWLRDELAKHVDVEQVFFDQSTLQPGVHFLQKIEASIISAHTVLVVIGPQWLELLGGGRSQRGQGDQEDIVYVELTMALERGKRIIPLLFDGAKMPPAHQLPPELRDLAFRNAWTMTRSADQVEKLAEFVKADEQLVAARAVTEVRPVVPGPDVVARERSVLQFLGLNPPRTRNGYRVNDVVAGLDGLVTRMVDHELCIGLRPDYFKRAGRLAKGYDPDRVNAFVRSHRRLPTSFRQGLRLLLSDAEAIGVSESESAKMHEQLRMDESETLLGALVLRPGRRGVPQARLVLTDRAVGACYNGKTINVPYHDIAALDVSISDRFETVPAAGDQGGFGDTVYRTQMAFTYRGTQLRLPEVDWSAGRDNDTRVLITRMKELAERFPPASAAL